MKLKVMLVDDHAIVRDGLQMIIGTQRDMQVLAGFPSAAEALESLQKLAPDVVVMDISMPELNGIEATRKMLALVPELKIIILTMHESPEYVGQAFRAGAMGFMLKKSAGIEIIKAIRAVRKGHRFFGRGIEPVAEAELDRESDPYNTLSQRERQVMRLVVEGKTSKEIAGLIFISAKSVETYRSRLMRKLDVDNVAGLVKYALRRGLVTVDE